MFVSQSAQPASLIGPIALIAAAVMQGAEGRAFGEDFDSDFEPSPCHKNCTYLIENRDDYQEPSRRNTSDEDQFLFFLIILIAAVAFFIYSVVDYIYHLCEGKYEGPRFQASRIGFWLVITFVAIYLVCNLYAVGTNLKRRYCAGVKHVTAHSPVHSSSSCGQGLRNHHGPAETFLPKAAAQVQVGSQQDPAADLREFLSSARGKLESKDSESPYKLNALIKLLINMDIEPAECDAENERAEKLNQVLAKDSEIPGMNLLKLFKSYSDSESDQDLTALANRFSKVLLRM